MKTPQAIHNFARIATEDASYNSAVKAQFHRKGVAALKQLALDLELVPGTFDIRSNKGGIAVSGEITLHSESLYVQLFQSAVGTETTSILYRSCKGRKDYSGGRNQYLSVAELAGKYEYSLAVLTQVKDNVAFMVIP